MVRFLSDSANDPSVIVDTLSSSEPSRASENLSQIDKSWLLRLHAYAVSELRGGQKGLERIAAGLDSPTAWHQ